MFSDQHLKSRWKAGIVAPKSIWLLALECYDTIQNWDLYSWSLTSQAELWTSGHQLQERSSWPWLLPRQMPLLPSPCPGSACFYTSSICSTIIHIVGNKRAIHIWLLFNVNRAYFWLNRSHFINSYPLWPFFIHLKGLLIHTLYCPHLNKAMYLFSINTEG